MKKIRLGVNIDHVGTVRNAQRAVSQSIKSSFNSSKKQALTR